jgi:hypothetical protein
MLIFIISRWSRLLLAIAIRQMGAERNGWRKCVDSYTGMVRALRRRP